jgi:enediyne biosynthesis protein E4
MGIFDLNNDGRKDVFTANAHAIDNIELYGSYSYEQTNTAFGNLGGGKFTGASAAMKWKTRAHRGCAFPDFDNDGRIDVAVSCLNAPAELLHNVPSPRQHWIELLLTGVKTNRDAISAKVKLILSSGHAVEPCHHGRWLCFVVQPPGAFRARAGTRDYDGRDPLAEWKFQNSESN